MLQFCTLQSFRTLIHWMICCLQMIIIVDNNTWFRCMCEACADLKERNFMKKFEARRCNFCDGSVIGKLGVTYDTSQRGELNYCLNLINFMSKPWAAWEWKMCKQDLQLYFNLFLEIEMKVFEGAAALSSCTHKFSRGTSF